MTGRDRDKIGQPVSSNRPSGLPGVLTAQSEDRMKAPHNGTYTLNGGRFRMFTGDPLPDGAVISGGPVAESAPEEEPEERAKPKAPENRALKGAPENRSAE